MAWKGSCAAAAASTSVRRAASYGWKLRRAPRGGGGGAKSAPSSTLTSSSLELSSSISTRPCPSTARTRSPTLAAPRRTMMRVASSLCSDALPKYTTSIPASRSKRVPTRASPARPLAFSTSTVIAAPRSPGIGCAGAPSPPQPATRAATPSINAFIAFSPTHSRRPPSTRAGPSPTSASIRCGAEPPREGPYLSPLVLSALNPANLCDQWPGPVRGNRRGTACALRHPSRGRRRRGSGRRRAHRDPVRRRQPRDPLRPARAPSDPGVRRRAGRHEANQRGPIWRAPAPAPASHPPSARATPPHARYARDARAKPEPTAAGSRADPWVRADAFPEDDVVQQPRLADAGGDDGHRASRDTAHRLHVLVHQRAVFGDHARRVHRFEAGALQLDGIRFSPAPGLLQGAQCPGQCQRRAALVGAQVGVARRQRQPVQLTHRRGHVDGECEIEVLDQPLHEHRLLKILAAEHRNVRLHDVEQLGDDREHPREVAGPRGAFERVRDRGGPRHDADHRLGAVHRGRLRHEQAVYAAMDRAGPVVRVVPGPPAV